MDIRYQESDIGVITAQRTKVGEHPVGCVIFEFECWPEPKVLQAEELAELVMRFGNSYKVAGKIGASEAFVRLSLKSD